MAMWQARNEFQWRHDIAWWERVREVFEQNVDRSCPCHAWLGTRDPRGYGKVHLRLTDGTTFQMPAHRLAWILATGYVEKKLHVCHICVHKHCVNVDHLYAGTPKMNTDDWRLFRSLECAIAVP